MRESNRFICWYNHNVTYFYRLNVLTLIRFNFRFSVHQYCLILFSLAVHQHLSPYRILVIDYCTICIRIRCCWKKDVPLMPFEEMTIRPRLNVAVACLRDNRARSRRCAVERNRIRFSLLGAINEPGRFTVISRFQECDPIYDNDPRHRTHAVLVSYREPRRAKTTVRTG